MNLYEKFIMELPDAEKQFAPTESDLMRYLLFNLEIKIKTPITMATKEEALRTDASAIRELFLKKFDENKEYHEKMLSKSKLNNKGNLNG